MRIKKIITRAFSVLLAGIISMAVFTACGENEDKKSDSLSAKEMLMNVFDKSFDTNSLLGIFSGKADAASKSNAVIEFKKGVTDALGTEVKPLLMTFDTKLKGNKAGTDIAVSYDGKNLVSLNGVYDNEAKTVYIKVPELSDAYLSASSKDLDVLKEGIVSSGTAVGGIENFKISDLKKLTELKAVDYEDILNDYIKATADKLPKASKEEKFEGAIESVEYKYNIKTYTLTADNGKKLVENLFDKLKSDDKIKEIAVGVLGSAFEVNEENYASKINKAKDSLLKELDSKTSNAEIGLIYDGDDIVGIKYEDIVFISVDKNDAYALNIEGKGIKYSLTAVKDGKKLDIDCEVTVNLSDEKVKDFSLTEKINDYEVIDKENCLSNGSTEVEAVFGDKKIKIVGTDKAEKSKLNTEMDVSVNDVEYAAIAVTSEITNASDITIPKGTVYTLDQIEKYQSSMKLDNLFSNFKTVLGKDLTAAISKLSESFLASKMGGADDIEASEADDEGAIMLEDYYNDDGTFNYDKLKEDLGEEEYEAFMSQINIEDLEIDADDIEL